MSVIRGESWKLAYAVEGAYKTAEGTAALVNTFGIFQTASMPDPTIDIQPFWGHSTTSKRNWFTAYKGKVSLEGSISDILVLTGQPLFLPLGTCVTTGSYTHTMSEANDLKSITLQVTYADTATPATTPLMRRYYGGKIGSATWGASEGGFLTMSLDRIAFTGMYHNLGTASDDWGDWYSAAVADITPSYPCDEPFLFSYGALTLGGTPFARVRSFRLSIDNSLDAKYYITGSGVAVNNRLPYEHREGRRNYRLNVTIDIEDAALYKELLRMGSYSDVYKGFQTIMTFTRGTGDTITFTTPPSAPACGGDNMGCLIRSAPHNIVGDPLVSVNLDILPRSLSIVVVDDNPVYEGET